MSIKEKLTQIAENMQDVYGRGRMMGELAGYERGYDEGAFAGGLSAREQCLMTHYTTTFYGNGTEEFVHQIPFKPDIVTVFTTNSYTSYMPYTYRGFTFDLRACGRHMGVFYYSSAVGGNKSGWLVSNFGGQKVYYQDGAFHCKIIAEQLKNVIWVPFIKYHLIAVRFPEESGKEMLREQILSLPDEIPAGTEGRLEYAKTVVDGYFTEEEWESLVNQKPNWEFVLS